MTTLTETHPITTAAASRRSVQTSLPRATWARLRAELQSFSREPSTILFGWAFPIILFSIFASIFTEQYTLSDASTFTGAQLYLAGMIAVSAMTAGFQDNASTITTDREDGSLARLYTSPMPRAAYLGGRLALVVANTTAQVLTLLAVAHFGFDVPWPTDWFTFGWLVILGTAACTAAGIATSGLLRSARAASALATGLTNVLAFFSGAYVPISEMPDAMVQLSKLFPVYWIAHGMRSVIMPSEFASAVEPAGEWQLGWAALVLAAWLVVGLLVTSRTCRWQPSQPTARAKRS